MSSVPHRITGVAAAALLGAALLAPVSWAQTSPPPQSTPPAPMAAPSAPAAAPAAKHSARVEARIKQLHTQLKITPEQEAKWGAVADTMRDNAASLDQLAQQRSAQRGHMSALEDLQSYEAIADAHADGLKKLVPAFSDLYAAMSDTQKKNADRVFGQRPATARRTASTPPKG